MSASYLLVPQGVHEDVASDGDALPEWPRLDWERVACAIAPG